MLARCCAGGRDGRRPPARTDRTAVAACWQVPPAGRAHALFTAAQLIMVQLAFQLRSEQRAACALLELASGQRGEVGPTGTESAMDCETMAGSVRRGGWLRTGPAAGGGGPTTVLPAAPACPAGWLTAASWEESKDPRRTATPRDGGTCGGSSKGITRTRSCSMETNP